MTPLPYNHELPVNLCIDYNQLLTTRDLRCPVGAGQSCKHKGNTSCHISNSKPSKSCSCSSLPAQGLAVNASEHCGESRSQRCPPAASATSQPTIIETPTAVDSATDPDPPQTDEPRADNIAAIAHYETGEAYLNEGDWETALDEFNQAIQIDPEYAEAYSSRGLIQEFLGNFEAAIEDYDQAIALDPQNAEAYYNRGNTWFVLGEYEVAIEDYSMVIALDPQSSDAYYNRGIAHDIRGRYEMAIEDFRSGNRP